MNIKRCAWSNGSTLEQVYHDEEWGRPVHDDRLLFESLILDGAQAGLSWALILKKRENYRKAFDNFDARKIARYSEKKIAALREDAGIIRNQLKIRSAVTNAQAFLAVQEEFGSFDSYLWQQACLRPRERFWDIPVPKIDSAFDNLLVSQPSWSLSVTQQPRKLVAAPHSAPI